MALCRAALSLLQSRSRALSLAVVLFLPALIFSALIFPASPALAHTRDVQTSDAQASDAPAPQATNRIEISNGVAQGLLIRKVNPIYPPLAREARIQGTVILKVLISNAGDVKNLQLVSGHPMLAPAAIEAVKQWKYQPYLLNGEPVNVATTVTVNFVLSDNPPRKVIGDVSVPLNPDAGSTEPRVRVSEGVMRALRIQQIDPVYPPLALQTKIEGVVIMKEFINASGDIESLQLISGHPMLVQSTIEAVKQWKYKPYLLNGEPVAVESLVRVSFALSKETEGEGSVIDAPLPPISDAPASGMAVPKRVRVSSGVASGLLVTKVPPEYPEDARAARIQGVVILKAEIDSEGNVANLELVSGHPLLAPAAIEAVKQWKYKPYLLNGVAVPIETQIQVNFILNGP
jgi:TonB family protein